MGEVANAVGGDTGAGAQIVPPVDAEIEAAIQAVGPLAEVPLGQPGEVLGSDLAKSYVDRVAGVVDRFGQIAPRLLFAVDGYRYGGKEIDLRERIAAVMGQLPPVAQLVVIPYLSAHPDIRSIPRATLWDEWLGPEDSRGPMRCLGREPF